MSDWISMDEWHRCREMERPGIVFEISNAEGQSMITHCIETLPKPPFDWKSAPVRFRAIVEPQSQHSNPMPKPKE